jgi:hypothetical protein
MMGLSDHEYVNFSEDYELNHHLQKLGKSQSEANRVTLKKLGDKLKQETSVYFLTHLSFRTYLLRNLHLLA